MERINLKQLKDALNKLQGEKLENFYLTHKMAIEEPEIKMGFVFYCDEEDFEKHMELYDTEAYKVLEEFAKEVEEDCKKVAICILDEDKVEDYAEDFE